MRLVAIMKIFYADFHSMKANTAMNTIYYFMQTAMHS